MSFDIFVHAYRNGENFRFPAVELRRRFAPYIVGEEPGFWSLEFPDGEGHGEVFTDKGDLTGGFMVARPAHALAFWEIVAGLLRDCPCVLYWPMPKDSRPIVGDPKVIPHLPAPMVEGLGVPIVSTDAEFIRSYVGDHS